MSEQTFRAGDVVQLKSGRASMTVESIEETTATCCWLDSHKRLQREVFAVSLMMASTEDAPIDLADLLADLQDD